MIRTSAGIYYFIYINPWRINGLFYRSPNSSEFNTAQLNEIMRKLSSSSYTSVIFLGDYNYPEIDWFQYACSSNEGNNFIECIRDCFLHQYIMTPTRGRGGNRPSVLDLVLSMYLW